MRILAINDDGIASPGLWASVRALRRVGEVFVVAPQREQSGVGASLTLHSPVKVRPWTPDAEFQGCATADGAAHLVTAYAAEGTPGDCCILALETLAGAVDLVVSGINSGSNTGWDVMVSGTVGGAVQGYVRGRNTIAVSVASVTAPRYDVAGRLLEALARRLAQRGPSASSGVTDAEPLFLNLNIPNIAPDRVAGLRATRLGGLSYRESVRLDGSEGEERSYRIARNRPGSQTPAADSDIWALKNNYVSLTPLTPGLGNDSQLPHIESLLDGLMD